MYPASGESEEPYIQIVIDYQCDERYLIYRSENADNWSNVAGIFFESSERYDDRSGGTVEGCSVGSLVDMDLPIGADQLYYRYAHVNSEGEIEEMSGVTSIDPRGDEIITARTVN